jgi:glycosyltransferase involved in cell wall biosynthesis
LKETALKVAIIHYWLVGMRGGERVLERLLSLYPDADIFTLVYDPSRVSSHIKSHKIHTSFIQDLPFATTLYQKYLPLMPRALERFDLSKYDLVISSESGPAKGVIPAPSSHHVCYCHSPMRYLWDHGHQYRANSGAIGRLGMDIFSSGLRVWDVSTSHRVDAFAANSNFIASRIKRYYGRSSTVIHPPVDRGLFKIHPEISESYLWVGQLTQYKRPDLAVEAFNRLQRPLLVVGQGEMKAGLRKMAKDNITFVDQMSFDDLRIAYGTSKALIFTAQEDFGIVPVEAMASGRPVIAFGSGGILDTVVPNVSGVTFSSQNYESLAEKVLDSDYWISEFDAVACRESTKRFSPERFDREFIDLVKATIEG